MMKIININDLKNFNDKTIITIGFFDGIHKGHQKILNVLVKKAKYYNAKSVVISFDNDILNLWKLTNCLMSLNKKIKAFKSLKIDYLLLLEIKDNFQNLNPDEFVKLYLEPLNCLGLVLGSDFSFAKNKMGNINYFKENTLYKIFEIKDVYYKNNKISSSYIRNLLLNGAIKEANKLLYMPFSLKSRIIKGLQNGQKINFKTANLKIYNSCYLLKHGVYFGYAYVNKNKYKAMINVGYNPTIKNNKTLKIEAHLLNFNQNLYNHIIEIEFLKYHRKEHTFKSLIYLKKQLQKDLKKLELFS